ncbi:MAG: xanthine dehydrogenase family protein molybdopterin-binding subunit [Burkholderiales bacterium]|nr:xanthine dehydrogenase family protein molybdopterin-binding subunit [Burkholderiales bacterium]
MRHVASGGIGAPVARVEDRRFVTGQGRFTADNAPSGMLHAAFVRSPHAHALIVAIDTAAARAMPGVRGVFTHADLEAADVKPLPFAPMIKRADGKPMQPPARHALASGFARHVGEAVAMVVADSPQAAQDAAEMVAIEWEAQDAVADVRDAISADAPRVNAAAPDNALGWFERGDAAAVDAAFAMAAHVARIQVVNNRVIANALEPRAALADWSDRRLTLRIGCQNPHLARQQLGDIIFGIGAERVRVIVEDIGGGFGAKSFLYPEYVAVALAARALHCPVRWVASRAEAFLADSHGRDNASDAELALDGEGRFLALRVKTLANVGAYLSYLGAVIPTLAGTKPLAGVYRTPLLRLEVQVVQTHTAPVEAYRGAGRPEAIFLMERLVDAAARVSGIDANTLRRKNMIAKSEMPFMTAMGEVYDSGDFARVMTLALDAADWDGHLERRLDAHSRGRLAGRGLAYFIESTGAANPVESVRLELTTAGIAIYSGTQNMGQGLETAYAQLVVDRLGVPLDQVRIVQGDTDQIARGGGSGGSRSLFIGGSAILHACEALHAQAQAAGANPRGTGWFEYAAARGGRVEVEGKVKVSAFSWPNGCHICEVEIDRDTGAVEVTRFTAIDDVGVVVNPVIVHGQAEGAIVQGIGQALSEAIVYERATGQLQSGSFMDYALPRAGALRHVDVRLDETSPCTTNPLGAKGAGEGGSIGAPPAVVNAVLDALAPLGVAHLDMPLTAPRVWRAMRDAGA